MQQNGLALLLLATCVVAQGTRENPRTETARRQPLDRTGVD